MCNPIKKNRTMKTYSKPSIRVSEIQLTQMIAESGFGFGSGYKGGRSALGNDYRGYGDEWDEEWDEDNE